jgi:negative regulator of sigma E activity
MSDPMREQLSACLDGELPEAELDLLLKQVQRDTQLGASLGRYSLIGEAMRNARPMSVSRDFSAKIAATLAAETPASLPPKTRLPAGALGWLKPAAGVAIAAGVATIAVLTLQPDAQQMEYAAAIEPDSQSQPIVTTEQSPSYIVPTRSAASPTFIPATRLTNYVVAHSEYSTPLGRRTVLSGVLSEDDSLQPDLQETGNAASVENMAEDPVQP